MCADGQSRLLPFLAEAVQEKEPVQSVRCELLSTKEKI